MTDLHEDDPHYEHPEDEAPTAEELEQIRRTTPADAAVVDALLLAHCTDQWRKVAMVVGSSLDEFEARFPALPFVYLQLRIQALADQGRLESNGDLRFMQHSEVRLPSSPAGTP